jgi:hypothetical protein
MLPAVHESLRFELKIRIPIEAYRQVDRGHPLHCVRIDYGLRMKQRGTVIILNLYQNAKSFARKLVPLRTIS